MRLVILPGVQPGSSPQLGDTYGSLMIFSVKNGATWSLNFDQAGTRGVNAALLATALRTPLITPPNRPIVNDTAPKQWLMTWMRRPGPTAFLITSSAGG